MIVGVRFRFVGVVVVVDCGEWYRGDFRRVMLLKFNVIRREKATFSMRVLA
jgi:hypothetical protein